MPISENLTLIRERIAELHPQQEVSLLAVSKTFPVDYIKEAIEGGQFAFGENYAQEGAEKIQYFREHFPTLKLQWHFIGPLQSNKTRLVAEHFDWVQSIDRLKIAKRLSEQRPSSMEKLNILVEVNIDAQDSKSGVAPSELPELLKAVSVLPNLRLRGLMCIPKPREGEVEKFEPFRKMRAIFDQYRQEYALDTLSMGMSADFVQAIQAGSTMVRVGSAIFGARNYKK